MTVLAWGNSVGDYTTNGSLAQRGLSEMSMAACFAGPSFNLLIGLGCGLLSQKESLLSNDGLNITLMPSVKVGFICLIFNCVTTIICGLWNNGMIPKMWVSPILLKCHCLVFTTPIRTPPDAPLGMGIYSSRCTLLTLPWMRRTWSCNPWDSLHEGL